VASTSRWDDFPRNQNCKDGRHSYCKPCHNARGKETYTRLYGTRHYHLRRRYGIGANDFDALVAQQNGVCAICGFNCNGGLGQFKDSIDSLVNAAAYLRAHDPEVRALDVLARQRAGELSRTPG
jgi:hypothetical protein